MVRRQLAMVVVDPGDHSGTWIVRMADSSAHVLMKSRSYSKTSLRYEDEEHSMPGLSRHSSVIALTR